MGRTPGCGADPLVVWGGPLVVGGGPLVRAGRPRPAVLTFYSGSGTFGTVYVFFNAS